MNLETQFKLKNNDLYIKFLRENSFWYKDLNRDPNKIDEFINDMKDKYKLRTIDKIDNIKKQLETIQTFMSILK